MRTLPIVTALAAALVLNACDVEPVLEDVPSLDAGTTVVRDAGAIDASTVVVDAGLEEPDAGPEPVDAGPEEPDAGPVVIDAGPEPIDAGPVVVDAGPPPQITKFVVLGDQGEGNPAQHEVAAAIKAKCDAEGGCDFGLLLGDNFYDEGVESIDDPQWQTKFEQPYRDVNFPFYAVLGNHDYGGTLYFRDYGGLGNEFDKGPNEVEYAQSGRSTKWKMPSTFYTFKHKNLGFVMLDTNSILWDSRTNGNQQTWYAGAVAALQPADWVFVAGHHPYKSNGKHGNAGHYELGDVLGNITLPIVSGENMKDFFEGRVCGTVDLVFSGHDHNRQWLEEKLCGAELVISGAGAKVTPDENRGNRTFFEEYDTPGFLFVRIEGRRLTGQFLNKAGRMEFERVLQK